MLCAFSVPGSALVQRVTQPRLRSLSDRLRQIALFEVGGLLLITPPFTLLSGVPIEQSAGLLVMMAIIAAIWNAGYNTTFDWFEGRATGRTADRRPLAMRIVHAVGFEGGLLLMSLPAIMWWTGMGVLEALLADVGLSAAYLLYAFAFNLAYDRYFPISA
ncbi:MAG: PACE efflux transporter [Rhodocyclaceae bacterium]|nr:PACE efflux transporter [Rhodocyclaceae bacterium]MCP5232627.1 PACE efflux transporter [Zoogloeaceae bacterium]MCB1911116.1 PACE efflux transporter [Rhodocyclaceae bacterium]MCP5240692.1 PACE efflux transporter [Zoogloeaceae bacterium]MCP5253196.1 PACE efflux transporter [Zoogloeaceae bacterium]